MGAPQKCPLGSLLACGAGEDGLQADSARYLPTILDNGGESQGPDDPSSCILRAPVRASFWNQGSDDEILHSGHHQRALRPEASLEGKAALHSGLVQRSGAGETAIYSDRMVEDLRVQPE